VSMDIDLFADTNYGKLALQKIAPTNPDFRLYYAGWMGKDNDRQVMKVTGAVFRLAKSGKLKGQLSIMVPDTSRTAYVTPDEMTALENSEVQNNKAEPL
jgi:hypothetical protein